ncbi:uncharacterized protein LOC135086093 isoform X2 [Ostrinia nubilalis]|uniref:uncharacterized protein LOC135086093 isoform X2 n=1 Tax=Ostrinia nubilalis TaxID=29057 RepID=UPI0030825E8A
MMSEPYLNDKQAINSSDTVAHSRLLKYLLPPPMADIKYKFEYTAPENVESEVPSEQKLRDSSAIEKPTIWDENNIDDREDYVLAPVVTVTKNEATFTKGDMKLQKVTVTENVSEIRNGVFHTIKAPSYPPIYSDVIPDSPIRKMEPEERKTRIPTRFKNAVNRVRRERSMPAKKAEAQPNLLRRSSIPRLKPKAPSPKPEDEFERLYGEIADSPTDIDISLLNNKVDDPEKVEDCFEEIIHAYDEKKAELIDVDKLQNNNDNNVTVEKKKQSKIPMLKRKSEAEIEVPKSEQMDSKSIPSGDKNKVRDSVAKVKEASDIKPSRIAVTKKNFDNDNLKLKTTYQRVKSVTRDGPKHELQIENIVQVSMEQDISPDNFINIDNVSASEPIESSVEIVEMSPVLETISPNSENSLPYIVEVIESPTIVELQSSAIEIEEATEYEPKVDVNKADNVTENKTPVDPIKVISMDRFQNLIQEKTKENDKFKPVIEKYRNGSTHHNNNEVISAPKDILRIEKDVLGTTSDVENKKEFTKPVLRKTVKPEPKKESNDEEDNGVKYKSVLSKIAMFEQRPDDKSQAGIRPKPAVRCAYRRRLAEEQEDLETSASKTTQGVDDDLHKKPAPPTSKVPHFEPSEDHISSKPIIVSEIIKTVDKPAKNEPYYEVNNNTFNTDNLRISRMEIKTEEVAVSIAVEENIPENETVQIELISEVKDVSPLILSRDERVKKHLPNRYYSFEVDYSPDSSLTYEKPNEIEIKSLTSTEIEYAAPLNDVLEPKVNLAKETNKPKYQNIRRDPKESPFDFTPKSHKNNNNNRKIDTVMSTEDVINAYKARSQDNLKKAKSTADLDLGDAVKGKVQDLIVRMKSVDRSVEKKDVINPKERPRKKSVSEKIALFEGFLTIGTMTHVTREEQKRIETARQAADLAEEQAREQARERARAERARAEHERAEEEYNTKLKELQEGKETYGRREIMPTMELSDGSKMPILAVGTALLDPRLAPNIIATAIDLGYRAIDTAFIYGNEAAVGQGIKMKIDDGTIQRSDLFVISKLWSTFHRTDLVETACRRSLEALGLDYIDLYLIHNPMSFKEGADPIPTVAKVVQYSDHDFLDAWYGMEDLVSKGLVKSIGVSNFNSSQLQKILDKARIKPVVNQVECHPYLSQQRLYNFCDERNIKLSCFGVLGSKGTPAEYKNTTASAIDDALVKVTAAGMDGDVSPAQVLIRYQIQSDHAVVVKASTAKHMWDNLKALDIQLTESHMDALRSLNRNKRTFAFKGMGDTHKNYPFHAAF